MRYILHPGYIRSKNDGNLHFISANTLIGLYKVDPKLCITHDDKRYEQKSGDVHLRPRYNGNYNID